MEIVIITTSGILDINQMLTFNNLIALYSMVHPYK